MPKSLTIVGDRIYRMTLHHAGLKFAATSQPTVDYLCTWASFFEAIGEAPPSYAKPNVDATSARRWLGNLDPHSRKLVKRLVGYELEFM
jgi:hypothetical protein